MKRIQKQLETKNFGRIFEGYLYSCDDCNAFFAIPGDLEPVSCPVCGCREVDSNDKEESLIISSGATFWS